MMFINIFSGNDLLVENYQIDEELSSKIFNEKDLAYLLGILEKEGIDLHSLSEKITVQSNDSQNSHVAALIPDLIINSIDLINSQESSQLYDNVNESVEAVIDTLNEGEAVGELGCGCLSGFGMLFFVFLFGSIITYMFSSIFRI